MSYVDPYGTMIFTDLVQAGMAHAIIPDLGQCPIVPRYYY